MTYRYKTNFKKRILATLLDYGFFLLLSYAYIEFFGHQNDSGGKAIDGLLTLPLWAMWFVYFIIMEARNGGTVGHLGCNLKVLTIDRKEIDFSHSLKRHLLDCVDILFYGLPAIIAIKNTDKHQRLGDLLAKTIVVDTTDPDQYFDKDNQNIEATK